MLFIPFSLFLISFKEVTSLAEDEGFYLHLAPRMPPRPPRPPKPPITTTSLPLISTSATMTSDVTNIATEYAINEGNPRCKFGSDSTSDFSSSETEAERLYVDTYTQAQCPGIIHWWSVCLWSKSDIGAGSVTLLIIENITNGIYNITGVTTYDVEIGRRSYDNPVCVQFKNEMKIEVHEGNRFGFLLHGSIYMALAMVTPNQGNNVNATLRVSLSNKLSSFIRNANQSMVLQITEENLNDFEASISLVAPLLQVILGNESQSEPTIPTEQLSEANANILRSPEFLSLLGSTAAIIVVLSIILLAMSCCLWRLNCCLEMCPCCFQKRRQVTHVVQVEPAFEQSMLYNEMYATGSPIQRRSGQVMPNPAYNLDQSRPLRIGVRDDLSSSDNTLEMTALPCESVKDQIQKAASLYDHPTSRLFKKDNEISELEHTYETVNIR